MGIEEMCAAHSVLHTQWSNDCCEHHGAHVLGVFRRLLDSAADMIP